MGYSKEEKGVYISKMKTKTKKFAVDIIHSCNTLPNSQATRTITYQIIKSATSTGANYRAACRGRSKAEFHSKISIVIEEADESQYWIELIKDTNIKCDLKELERLNAEISEILAIVNKARSNTQKA